MYKKIKYIIVCAVKDGDTSGKQAMFKSYTLPDNLSNGGTRRGLIQERDYYNTTGNQPANCKPAILYYVPSSENAAAGYIPAHLLEDQNKGGCGENPVQYADTSGIKIKNGIPADIQEIAKLQNYGSKPLGCPGYPDIVYTGTPNTSLNYNCPDGENSVQAGVATAGVIGRTTTSTEVGVDAPINEDACSGPLSWILCPVIDATFYGLDRLEQFINTLLFVDTNPIFNTTSADAGYKKSASAYYAAWAGFRTIALGLIVIAALVIVIASAFGFEILDAYTIRKAMPRLFIAVIAIALSWELMEFVITLSNDIGMGIRSLIYAPFVESGYGMIEFKTGEQTLVAALILGGASTLGLIGLFTFALTGMLSLGIAFLVLVFREVLIVVLVILAPIGIAAFILPGTQKAYKLWENALQVMLVAFPIISAMIAGGHVISMVAWNGGDATFINKMIAYIAFIIPYFMLPMAFRWAGGVMATLGGISNDKSRGAFDRLSKYRQGQTAKNLHNMKTGNRWQEGGKIQKYAGINRMKRGLNFATSEGTIMSTSPGRRSQTRDIRRRMEMENIMKSPKWQAIKEDDNATRAATYGSRADAEQGVYEHLQRKAALNGEAFNEQQGLAEAKRAASAVQSSIGFGRPQAITAAQQLATTGTGYRDLDDQATTIARAAGNNDSTAASIAGYNNFVNKQKGRHDLAPGAGNLIKLAQDKMVQTRAGRAQTDNSAQYMQDAWNTGSLYSLANGKGAATKNFVDHHLKNLDSADEAERESAGIALMEMQSMLPSASGENRDIIEKAMRKAGIDYTSSIPVDEQIATRAYNGSGSYGPSLGYDPAPTGEFTADALRKKARVYDRDAMTRADIENH